MFSRVLFVLALLLGMATGPVLPVAPCFAKAPEMLCGHCCADAGSGCCANSEAPAEEVPPLVARAPVDLKLAVIPVLACLGAQPVEKAPPVSLRRFAAAQRPTLPRVAVTCIRLV